MLFFCLPVRNRQHRKTVGKVKLERLHKFPALINKVCLGLRSTHCSSWPAPTSHTFNAVCQLSCVD